ncbi:MAG: energy transducer TonB, partial [Betaproteobacteria bacterium]
MTSTARLTIVFLFVFAARAHSATVSLVPQPAMQVVAMEVDGKGVAGLEDISIRELPERSSAMATFSLNSIIRRGAVVSTPARTAITFKSLNGVIIRMEPEAELYVDAVITGGEVYHVGKGAVKFDAVQPLQYLVVRHANIISSTQQARFTAEVVRGDTDIRFSVDRGAIDIEERLTLVDNADNRRIIGYESNTLGPGESRIATDDAAKRKELRYESFGAAKTIVSGTLQELAPAGNSARRRTILRHATIMALRFKKTREAIRYHEQLRATGDDDPYHLLSASTAIARACAVDSDTACAIEYYRKALAFAEALYPDGLHYKIFEIGRGIRPLHKTTGKDEKFDAFLTQIPQLESRMFNSTPVVIIKQGETKYPLKMREWGLQGVGEVEVTILADGSPQDLKVVKSPHPAFEQAIVKAVLASVFKPGTEDEKAVSRRILIPFSFRFEDSVGDPISDRDAPFSFPRNPGSGLPPELQYDEPPKIKVVAPVIYPREFLQNEITGHAKLAVVLNDKGLVRSVKVVDSSHPEFAAATKAMMQAWEFMPAIKDGKPIASAFVYVQRFHWDERDTGVNEVTRRLLKALKSSSSEIAEVDALDSPPKVRYQTQPVDPRPPTTNVEPSEEVVIEFFIDPDGGVQLPRIV